MARHEASTPLGQLCRTRWVRSLTGLAEALELNPSTVCHWAHGTRCVPPLRVDDVCAVLRITPVRLARVCRVPSVVIPKPAPIQAPPAPAPAPVLESVKRVPMARVWADCMHCSRSIARTRWFERPLLERVVAAVGRLGCTVCGGVVELEWELRDQPVWPAVDWTRRGPGRPTKVEAEARKRALEAA